MDVEQVPNKLFSHHRILPRPELDVEQVPDKDVGKMPNKLSAHHRIWMRPQMVGKFLPDRN